MAIYVLSDRTKKSIADGVGIPFDKVCDLSLEEEIELASKRYGRKIVFSRRRDNRRIGQGSPYLARRKFRTMEDVEKGLARMNRKFKRIVSAK